MDENVFEEIRENVDLSTKEVSGSGDINDGKKGLQTNQNINVDSHEQTIVDDSVNAITQELSQAKANLEAMRLDYLRAVANAENIRRRSEENIQKAYKFSIEKFAKELLPVLDSLEAALIHAGDGEVAKEGVEHTQAQLLKALENNNVKVCSPSVGDRFDPHTHQAMAAVVCNQEANSIVSVMQKGYLLKERVLRPALVTVAKAKDV